MKKIFAILMTVCLLVSLLCITAVPTSAAGGYTISVCGISYDGLEWALGVYDHFDDAWNEAIYYATHLEEAWNSSIRYETEEERPAVEGFTRILVYFYDNWKADSNGAFGSGIGFKDGAIYIPSDAKITVDLGGHIISRGLAGNGANGNAVYVDAGADVKIYNGSIIGNVHADKNAKTNIYNVYLAGNTVKNDNASSRFASIFGVGSLAMIVSLLALAASVASIGISIAASKKKAAFATDNNAKTEGEE